MRTVIFSVCSWLLLFTVPLQAESAPGQSDADRLRTAEEAKESRLPPVLPGEEVETRTGKKMRVWSSSGPVPVSSPSASPAPGIPIPGSSNIGVIVDHRDRGGLYKGHPSDHKKSDPANGSSNK